jgi:hypothetical protein
MAVDGTVEDVANATYFGYHGGRRGKSAFPCCHMSYNGCPNSTIHIQISE